MRTAISKFVCILFLIYFVSCDIFKTRTPSEPSKESSTFEPITEPELVLQNMVNSFKDGNSVNYAKSFSNDLFIFEASINARNKYGTQLTDWSLEKEIKCFESIQSKLQKNSTSTLTFIEPSYTRSSDVCEVTTLYKLIVPHTIANFTTTFRGQTQFRLVRDSKTGYWSIQKWIDSDVGSVATDSTWSDLKGTFAQ